MKDAERYEKILTQKIHSKEQLRRFANSLAEVESELQVVPRKVLVNGTPVDDIFSATYQVQDLAVIQKLLTRLLSVPQLDPDIIINGMPGRPFDVHVNVDLNRR